MPRIVIFTSALCGFCTRAKQLLSRKGLDYEEVEVTFDPTRRAEMTQLAGGRRTVPQIFIDDRHVGGADDLYALEREGRLDDLLAA